MTTPLIVDVLRDQLVQLLLWYRHQEPACHWGMVLHRRNERGHFRFGAVTPTGESLLVSDTLLERFQGLPCWLEGVVPVRLEVRHLSDTDPRLTTTVSPESRPRLVEALAVCFDPAALDTNVAAVDPAFMPVAGIVTPATLASELFVLTRDRPEGWPR